MNLLLFSAEELDSAGRLLLRGRRLDHINGILKLRVGDSVRVGQIDGHCGIGTLLSLDGGSALLDLDLQNSPPTALPLTVVMALPRPKMLRRILRGLAETGVKTIHLINSYRVEKSYWQSPLLNEAALREALLAGIEQAMDTVLPEITLHRRFRPFAEDSLPALCHGNDALLADPGAEAFYPTQPSAPSLLLLGPEGGFIPFERDLLLAAGARSVSLGSRVLRVETALHCALGRHLTARC